MSASASGQSPAEPPAADENHEDHDHHDHEVPTGGRALTGMSVTATLHCLTGCAIGEVSGMVIGTAAGFPEWATVALAVALAFLFGYTLTSLPLLRAGMALSTVVPIALAVDTVSITVMEIIDNVIMLAVPGAMDAGVGSLLFWGSLAIALVIAFVLTVPVNRWLILRGKGHVVLHETGVHGGPPTWAVATATAIAAVFGTAVLIAEFAFDDSDEGATGHGAAIELDAGPEARHGGGWSAARARGRGVVV